MKPTSGRSKIFLLLVCALLSRLTCASAADDEEQVGNWFNDPFVQVRAGVADCPEPLGPRITRREATLQEHSRAERGTSCFLAGECSKQNAYLYDAPIAAAVQKQFDADPALARDSSLWITVTRRFVYLEGCSASRGDDIARVETMIRSVADVQLVLVNVAKDARGHLPYRRFSEPDN